MSLTPPHEAVAAVLAAAELGLSVPPAPEANLFTGHVQPPTKGLVPARAVFCLRLGSGKNDPIQGVDLDKKMFRVQVRVRVGAAEYDAGGVLAQACLDALHRSEPAGYAYCLANAPAPDDIGTDSHGLPEWSFIVRLGTIA